MDNLPNVIVIKCVLFGEGLVGRPTRIEFHREAEYGINVVYRSFGSVAEASRWLDTNGYRYVPASHAEWVRM